MRVQPSDLTDPIHAFLVAVTGLSASKVFLENQNQPIPSPPYCSFSWIDRGKTSKMYHNLSDTVDGDGFEDVREMRKTGIVRARFFGSGALDYADLVAEDYSKQTVLDTVKARLATLGIDDFLVYGTEEPQDSTALLDGVKNQESAYVDLRIAWVSVILSEESSVSRIIGEVDGTSETVSIDITP